MDDQTPSKTLRIPPGPDPLLHGDSVGGATFASSSSSFPGSWQPPTPQELQVYFSQYEIRGILGRGGMGVVYQAWQMRLARMVAIKVLPADVEDDGMNYAERFKQEGRAMAKFRHPGIIAVYEAGETRDGLLYLVMECIEGTDVAQLVAAHGRLPMAQALGITSRVCEALSYAHSQGVVHRDIKPSNVIIEANGNVKVADFGLAKFSGPDGSHYTTSNVSIGTPDFMSPEALEGTGPVDHRADIYAVGGMLYQMLTGKVPHGRFAPPSALVLGLDKRLDGIVEKAMHSDPAKRYATAAEMQAEIAKIPYNNGNLIAGRTSDAAKTYHPLRAKLILVSVVVIALVGIVARGYSVRKNTRLGTPLSELSVAETGVLAASKVAPYVNTLGMKFVPVPITGGPTDNQRVLFSIWETRVRDYEVFAIETKREWAQPEFEQSPSHPAVNVNWDDAQAFCLWLTDKERNAGRLGSGQRYRLPTDHEWSCAVGIGDREDAAKSPEEKSEELKDVFPWGSTWPPPNGAGNYSGTEAEGHEVWEKQSIIVGYRDGFIYTAPAGSFPPNRFGVHDLGGNAWEWCEDRISATKSDRVLRGASFNNGGRGGLYSAKRDSHLPGNRSVGLGFRVVLDAEAKRRTATAATSRWRNAFAESPLKQIIAKADHTPKGYRLPSGNHWQISPESQRSGAVRIRGTDEGEKFASLFILHEDGQLERVRYLARNNEWLLSTGSTGRDQTDIAAKRVAATNDGHPHELLFARMGGRLITALDGKLLHDEADPSDAPGTFMLDIYADASVSMESVEYLDLDGVREAEMLTLLGIGKK